MFEGPTLLTYGEVVKLLESLGVMPEREPSLEPMNASLAALNLTIDPSRVIVVAGTNGKGTTCSALEALLLSDQVRTGFYSSPHLMTTTERIRIGGHNISEELFVQTFFALKQALPHLLSLSHFEVLTLMASHVFFSGALVKPVEFAIFEVGLGGTWDATNAIPHEYAIITSLDLDHETLLGNTLHSIAKNKFGIVSSKTHTVIHAPLPPRPEVLALAKEVAYETGSKWIEARSCSNSIAYLSGETAGTEVRIPRYAMTTPWGSTSISMMGKRSIANFATALTAFESLGRSPHKHLTALSHLVWPGRMEEILLSSETTGRPHGLRLFLSGDHNPAGMTSLIEILRHFHWKHLHLIVSLSKDKDRDRILGPLGLLPRSSLYLTEASFKPRRLSDYDSWITQAAWAHSQPVKVLDHVVQNAGPSDLILVTGSLYLVGELRKILVDRGWLIRTP